MLKTGDDNLTRWRILPVSLLGRVAAIKMMILPKINYLKFIVIFYFIFMEK